MKGVEATEGVDGIGASNGDLIFFFLAGLLVFLLVMTAPVSGQAPDWGFTVGREYVSSSDISSDGSLVIAGTTMGKVHLFDGDGDLLWTGRIPGRLITRISPDSSFFIVGSQESLEKNKGAVRCYDRNGTQLWRDITGWVTDIDFSVDAGKLVVGTRMGDVIVFDSNGNRLGAYNDFPKTYVVNGVGISGDGTRIAYSLCERKPALEVVTVSNGIRKISSRVENSYLIDNIKISDDGKCIVTESGEGTISELSFFDSNAKKIWSKSLSRINDIALTEDGGLVLAASEDSHLRVFSSSGDPVWNFSRTGAITALSINLDQGLIASGSGDGNIDVLNLSGDLMWSFLVERFPESRITDVRISSDGDSVIAVVNDKEILYYSLVACETAGKALEEAPKPLNTIVEMMEEEDDVCEIDPFSLVDQNHSLWNLGEVHFFQANQNQRFLDL